MPELTLWNVCIMAFVFLWCCGWAVAAKRMMLRTNAARKEQYQKAGKLMQAEVAAARAAASGGSRAARAGKHTAPPRGRKKDR
jgi:hypothetical protein|eukprot:SAG25_NODE_584_length_6756_cov_2.948776_6_plen_83_part_00